MEDVHGELIHRLGTELKQNEPLSAHTNFKIGGPAKYFLTARTDEQLVQALQAASELNIAVVVLGGGSNVLVSDKGVDALVIETRNNQWKIDNLSVWSEAGVSLGFLVQQTINAGLSGFEPLVAVPGTVGGAVYGNAGVPQVAGGFIGDWVSQVTVFRAGKIVTLARTECEFSYRESVFKHNSDIILNATFKLALGNKESSQELVRKYVAARKGQPYNKPSSGCIFTNIAIKNTEEVKQKFAGEEKLEEFLKRGQIPSSWLIDKALGLKGKTIGGIQVSADHANYLVNLGEGRAEEVLMMISYIKQQARDKLGIQLQEEVRYIGFDK